jgi:hypothetical protein
MLENKLKSEHLRKDQKREVRFWTETRWVFISSLTFVALFPAGLAAQTTSLGGLAPAQAAGFGTGVQTPLRFTGESVPENQVSLTVGASTLYDDNVLARNTERLSDEALSLESHFDIMRQTEHMTINFDYLPFFLLYRQFDQYDRLNHAADLSLTYRLASRVNLGLHDAFSYQNGVYPALTGQQILSGPTSPTALNQMTFAPTTRTLSNMPGLDLTFVTSQYTSLTFSGGYNQRKFGNGAEAGQPLYNSDGVSLGLKFQYRVTDHANFGFLLLHQDSTYQGGQIFGSRERSQIESVYLSVGSRLSPTVTVSAFGGPQYVRTFQSSGGSSVTGGIQSAGGGSITKEVLKTALNLSFQRSVSDGGGLYTSVKNTNVIFGARRRLVGRWDAALHGGASQVDTSLIQVASEKTESLIGGIDFSRPLRGASVFHISYDSIHQLSKGSLAAFPGFDRNQVTIGLDYGIKNTPLGQ